MLGETLSTDPHANVCDLYLGLVSVWFVIVNIVTHFGV